MFYFSLDFNSLIEEIPMSRETILRRDKNKVKQKSSGKEPLTSYSEAAASPVTVLSQAAGPTITLVIYFLFFNMFALFSQYNPLFSLALIKIFIRWLLFLSFPQSTKYID